MSQQDDIDRIRAGIERFNETGEIETEHFAADFEMHQASSIVDTAGVFRGRDALGAALSELQGSFEDLRFDPQQFLSAPTGEIIAVIRVTGRGRGSGVSIDNTIAWVVTTRGDETARVVVYEEPTEALADLNLDGPVSTSKPGLRDEFTGTPASRTEVTSHRSSWRDTARSMSRQDHTRLMERFTAAVTAREDPGELFVPDCRIENVATAVTDATYLGHDGVRKWISDIFDVLDDDARFEIEEILATGEDFLVARLCWAGLGAGSQIPLELRWPSAVWFRDGKIARAVGYWNATDALKAVGLRE